MDTEYSIKLRLEKITKSKLFIILTSFLLIIVTCIVVSFSLAPEIIKSHTVKIYKCDRDVHEHCYSNTTTHEIWEARIPKASRLNQLLYMTATPISKMNLQFNMTMEILVLHNNLRLADNLKETLILCNSGKCNTIVIFYLPYLEYESYDIIIRHKSRILSDEIDINLSAINPLFTAYQLGIKYGFFGLSLIFYVQFLIFSCKIPTKLWSFETKLLVPLGISLIVFNEPLLWVTIYFLDPLWSGVSVFCNTQFIAILLIFWLVDLQHYRKSKYNIYLLLVEILMVCTLFCLIFTGYLYIHQKLRYNPTYDWQHDLDYEYKEVFMGILIMLILIVFLIIFLCFTALSKLSQISHREKIIKKLNIVMISFGIIGLGIGAFQPIPKSSSLVLLFNSGFNLYVILLELLYSPTTFSILEYRNDKKIEYTLIKSIKDEEEMELSYSNNI